MAIRDMVITFLASTNTMQQQLIQINVIDDVFVERDENLTALLSLSTSDPSVTLSPGEAPVTILNDDGMFILFTVLLK